MLGQALKEAGVPRQEIILASKIGRYGTDEFDFRCECVMIRETGCCGRRQWEVGVELFASHEMGSVEG